jgi:long-subunit acyl-CoA synthetase (AMP-forming)
MIALRSPYINQIYVHGDIAHSFLVAVVVPQIELLRAWFTKKWKYVTLKVAKVIHFLQFNHSDFGQGDM